MPAAEPVVGLQPREDLAGLRLGAVPPGVGLVDERPRVLPVFSSIASRYAWNDMPATLAAAADAGQPRGRPAQCAPGCAAGSSPPGTDAGLAGSWDVPRHRATQLMRW